MLVSSPAFFAQYWQSRWNNNPTAAYRLSNTRCSRDGEAIYKCTTKATDRVTGQTRHYVMYIGTDLILLESSYTTDKGQDDRPKDLRP